MLIESAGGYTADAARLVMGGPMMGIALNDDSLPVTKACNSIYVPGAVELGATDPEMPCIRCGECATVCPANLTPQFLLQQYRSNNYERLQQLGLTDCIECGCCDYVCPSRIPLTSEFRLAKRGLWEIGFEKHRARNAEQRFAARNERLSREDSDRDRELTKQTNTIANPTDADSALDELLRRTGINDQQDRER
jgi:electron transport complex protein RnfC